MYVHATYLIRKRPFQRRILQMEKIYWKSLLDTSINGIHHVKHLYEEEQPEKIMMA